MLACDSSFLPINSVHAFGECLFILQSGGALSYSVESWAVNQLPSVPVCFDACAKTVASYSDLMKCLWFGQVPRIDGTEENKTLIALFDFTLTLLKQASGRRLSSTEVSDLVCFIASTAIPKQSSAPLVVYSDLEDTSMQKYKNHPDWLVKFPYRRHCRVSAVYSSKINFMDFFKEWSSIYNSKSGERAIFSDIGVKSKMLDSERRDAYETYREGPCNAVLLKAHQLSSLVEVIIRPEDTRESILLKVRNATTLATLQCTLGDNLSILRDIWHTTNKNEKVLGVSLSGVA